MSALETARAVSSLMEPGPHRMLLDVCAVEAQLAPRVEADRLQREGVALGLSICETGTPRLRARAGVALLQSGALEPSRRPWVVSTVRASLDWLEAQLDGEALAAFKVHPLRVRAERASGG